MCTDAKTQARPPQVDLSKLTEMMIGSNEGLRLSPEARANAGLTVVGIVFADPAAKPVHGAPPARGLVA